MPFSGLTGQALRRLHATAPRLADAITNGFVHALRDVFLTALPITVVAFGLSLFLREVRLRDRAHVGERMMTAPDRSVGESPPGRGAEVERAGRGPGCGALHLDADHSDLLSTIS